MKILKSLSEELKSTQDFCSEYHPKIGSKEIDKEISALIDELVIVAFWDGARSESKRINLIVLFCLLISVTINLGIIFILNSL